MELPLQLNNQTPQKELLEKKNDLSITEEVEGVDVEEEEEVAEIKTDMPPEMQVVIVMIIEIVLEEEGVAVEEEREVVEVETKSRNNNHSSPNNPQPTKSNCLIPLNICELLAFGALIGCLVDFLAIMTLNYLPTAL